MIYFSIRSLYYILTLSPGIDFPPRSRQSDDPSMILKWVHLEIHEGDSHGGERGKREN